MKLKTEGHKYIDLLISCGWRRDAVYNKLATKLGKMYGEHHFSKLQGQDLVQAVRYLKGLYYWELEKKARKKKAMGESKILPLAEQKRLLKRTIWQKILNIFG